MHAIMLVKNFVSTIFFVCLLQVNAYSSTPDQKKIYPKEICFQDDLERPDTKSEPLLSMDSDFLQEVITILSEHFKTNIQIKSVVQLSESERRNLILRITLKNSSPEVPESLILKRSLLGKSSKDDKKAFARFARDWAGLEFLNSLTTKIPLTPRFYGGSTKYHFILIEDLGEKHISLVDSLLGRDANEAKLALQRFMKGLGQLHAISYGNTRDYLKILEAVNPNAESGQDDVKMMFDDMIPKLESLMKRIGVSDTAKIRLEINNIILVLLEPGPFTTLIHGDICPDNVFDDSKKDELRFIDFEWAFVENALLDGTYLRMSMPPCWCAHTIPEDLIESLEALYRDELIKKIPAAKNDKAYYDAYTNACAFWMLKTILVVEDVLEKDEIQSLGTASEKALWEKEKNRLLPRVLSRLQAFIYVSKKYEKLPYLRVMAQKIMHCLNVQYPDAKPMDMYPAFAPNQ